MKCLPILLAMVGLSVGSLARGQEPQQASGHAEHVVVHADALDWGPSPPGLPPGSEMALLFGDPSKEGSHYVFRARFADGYTVPPHWHLTDESVTVLKGGLLVGKGEELDLTRTEELKAGAFFHMPKTMRHFVVAKGDTVIQIHGIGPFGITYVNPADDPRRQ